jgi:hypothetical protein
MAHTTKLLNFVFHDFTICASSSPRINEKYKSRGPKGGGGSQSIHILSIYVRARDPFGGPCNVPSRISCGVNLENLLVTSDIEVYLQKQSGTRLIILHALRTSCTELSFMRVSLRCIGVKQQNVHERRSIQTIRS